MVGRFRHPIAPYAFAAVSITLAIVTRFMLGPWVGREVLFETTYLAVLATACYGGLRPALAAVFLGAFATSYFFVLPYWSFQFAGPDQQMGLLLYVLFGVGIALLAVPMGASRKRAEAAAELIRDRERLLGTVTESAHVGLVVVDAEYQYLFANKAYAEIFGLGPHGIVGRHVPEVLADAWAQIQPRLDRALAGERVTYELELSPIAPVQAGRCYTVVYEPRVDEGGATTVVVVVMDITEQKSTERRLLAQNAVTRILAISPSVEDASPQILEALGQGLGWKRGELWLVDRPLNVLGCFASWQEDPGQTEELDAESKRIAFAPGVGLPGRVWSSRKTIWIPDVGTDAHLPRATLLTREGLHGAAGFPIILGADVLGVLCFFNEELSQPDGESITILNAVGSQIGQFIERKRAEEESHASEERFRQIAESIREVFWLRDVLSRHLLYVSPAYETVWGRTCEALYASPGDWLEAIHPEDRERVRTTSLQQQTMESYEVEYRIVRPDGSVRWIQDRGFPVYNDVGAVYRVAGVAEDVTERLRAEAASKVHHMRLEGIVNSAMDGIITVGEDQCILLFNAAAERMFGCRSEEVLGERVERFIPERFRQEHAAHIPKFGETGVAARTKGRFGAISGLRSDGEEFPLEASISQIQVEGQKLFTVTCRDVSERTVAAETQRKLEAQLHQSQKLEAFGQLAGGVAHDFNNLLTVILGCSEWLLTSLPPDSESLGMIGEINNAGERAAALTRQLLAFSRQQVVEPKVLNLNSVVDGVEKMLRRMIGEDIQLTTLLQPKISPVKIDPGQIEQLLMNLAVNARDAMPHGGQLTIETCDIELDELFAKSHAAALPGRYVLLAMSDTGSGMPPEVRDRIFEPFFTTKGIGRGTGLGLAVVHGIVQQSGGIVQVYSELGVGTVFKIYLPAVEETPIDLADGNRPEVPRGTETILLVEDENSVRELTARVLGEFGYTVLVAPGGEEALLLVDGQESNIDLLITDVVMPALSGRELAELLRTRHRGLKILFVSGYTDDVVVRHGVLQADVSFLPKPFTLAALAGKVREVLDS